MPASEEQVAASSAVWFALQGVTSKCVCAIRFMSRTGAVPEVNDNENVDDK